MHTISQLLSVLIFQLSCPIPVTEDATPTELQLGTSIQRELSGGKTHRYEIALEAGQFAKIRVEQKGIDVVLMTHSPKGAKLREVDSPNGVRGPERIAIAAETTGKYRVDVRSLESSAEAGKYEIKVETLLSTEEYRKYSIVPLDPRRLSDYAGVFEVSPQHHIAIGALDELGMILTFTDTKSRRIGAMHSHSETEFFTGPTIMDEYPVEQEFTFQRSATGEITGVTVRPGQQSNFTAKKVAPDRIETVSFRSGSLTLRGTLWLPAGPGPHPAIVYAHGSGPATRHIGFYPAWFTHLGFAVLAFDKRGAGESEGNWTTSSFDELAGDVLNGMAYLQSRPEVDNKRVGIWGVSQGGWIGSLAASRSPDAAFLVAQVGSGVPVWENVVHEALSGMKDAGLSASDLEAGEAFARKLFRMAADGANWDDIQEVVRAEQGKPWADFVYLNRLPRENFWWKWYQMNGHVDPAKILPQVKCPVLWLLGERDTQVPTGESQKRLQAIFANGHNPDVTIKVFPNASHPLMECKTGLRSELFSLNRLTPGFIDLLSNWLRQRK